MADGPEAEEDIFADLYDGDEVVDAPPQIAAVPAPVEAVEERVEAVAPAQQEASLDLPDETIDYNTYDTATSGNGGYDQNEGPGHMQDAQGWGNQDQGQQNASYQQEEERPIGSKEDG